MKKCILSLFFVLCSGIFWGQSVIKGTLQNPENEKIMGANTLLMSLPDSVLVKGGISNEKGFFELPVTASTKNMVLKITHLEYQTKIIPLEKDNLGTIQLTRKINQLKEVEVSANRTIIEQKGSVLVTNVAESSLKNLPQMTHLISFLPGVSRSFGGGIGWEVFGKGNVIFYINKKRVRNPLVELEAIVPQDVESISIETQPGAEYDNGVGAVIFIKLKKKQGEGWNALVVPQISFGQKGGRVYPFVKVGYQNGNTDVYAVGFFDNNLGTFEKEDKEISVFNSWKIFSETERTNNTRSFFAGAGVGHQVNDKHFFGGELGISSFPFGGNTQGSELLSTYRNETLTSQTKNEYLNLRKDKIFSATAYYEGELAQHLKLKSDVKFSMHSTDMENQVEQQFFPLKLKKQIFSQAAIKSFETKNTFNQKLSDFILSYGFDASNTARTETYNENKNENHGKTTSNWTQLSPFFTASFDWKKITLKTGLRYEYQDLLTEGNAKQRAIFSDFLPSVSLTFPWQKTFWSVSYNRRIVRPELYQMSDFVQFLTPYMYSVGSVELLPSFTQEFRLLTSYKNYSLALQYDVIKDNIGADYEVYDKNPDVLLKTIHNEGTYSTFKATLSGVVRYGIVTASNSATFFKQFGEGVYLMNRPMFHLQSQIQMQFTPKFSSLLFLNYSSGGNKQDHYHKESKGVSMMVSYKIPKYNLELFTAFTDIFASENHDHIFENHHLRINHFTHQKYQRGVYFVAKYNFNSVQKPKRGQMQQQMNFGF